MSISIPPADDPALRVMLELCQHVRQKLEQETEANFPADHPAAALLLTGLKAYIDIHGAAATADLLRELANTLSATD